jgi:GT2 family glycosyltransferase
VRVVVLNWNAAELTARCVRSLLATEHPPDRLEVVVADNGSVDGSLAELRAAFPVVRFVENGANLGFAEGCNRALRDLDGVDAVALINNDAEVEPGWLAPLLEVLASSADVGAACPKIVLEEPLVDVELPAGSTAADVRLVLADGVDVTDRAVRFRGQPRRLAVPAGSVVEVRTDEGAVRVPAAGEPTVRLNSMGVALTEYSEGLELGRGEPDPGPSDAEPRDVFAFSGGAVLLRAGALAEVGLFDPAYFAYYEDTDLAWRLRRAGWRTVCVPASVVHHRMHGSGGPRSAFFHLANARNWLLTVLRNGTPREVATAWRYGLARAWHESRRSADRDAALRWGRVWLAVALAAPGVLAGRWRRHPIGILPTDDVGGPLLTPPTGPDAGSLGAAVRRSGS